MASLFPDPEPDDPPPQAARLAPKLRALAAQGIYFGTSSWKYEGWLGSIYGASLYQTRGKLSKKKFDDHCLAEYAATFPCVCGDFAFYQFPTEKYWAKLFEATPEGFIFGLKVPENITVAKWPGHARYGKVAGETKRGLWSQPNPVPPWDWRRGTGVPVTAGVIGNRKSLVYHAPNCASVGRMKDENRVEFKTAREAEAKGYREAGDCR